VRKYNQVGRHLILLTLSQENNLHVQHGMLMRVIYFPPPAERGDRASVVSVVTHFSIIHVSFALFWGSFSVQFWIRSCTPLYVFSCLSVRGWKV